MGFAARALRTMGFDSLRIVGAPLQDSEAARKTGYGAHDLLDDVVNYTTLQSAVADIDLTIGTTAKERIKRYDNHAPRDIAVLLQTKHRILNHVGVVFGSEENGLSTEQLDVCDLVSTIPMAVSYPSLNLAQSVLIYAWELAKQDKITLGSPANPELQGLVKKELKELLNQLGFGDKPIMQQRILDRVMQLGSDDTELLMAVLGKIRNKE